MLQFDKGYDPDRPICPKCRYPLIHLRGYVGVSSADNTDLVADRYGRGVGFGIFRAIKLAWRRRWAKRMCREILPQYPFSLICPVCRIITKQGLDV